MTTDVHDPTPKTRGRQARRSRLTDDESECVAHNLGLAYTAAREMWRGEAASDHDDNIQEAALGLCKSILYFDPEFSQYSTYATWAAKYTIAQARERRGLPKHAILTNAIPIDTSTDDEPAGAEWLGREDPDQAERLDGDDRVAQLNRAVDALPERERVVIRARFFDGDTLVECGRRLGITKERVRQIEARAKQHLRMLMEYGHAGEDAVAGPHQPIDDLPRRERAVMEARMRGDSVLQIARRLGTSTTRIKKVQQKAEARLRKILLSREEVA